VSPSPDARVARSLLAGLRRRFERERALIALFDFGGRKSLGRIAVRVYAFGVLVTFAIAISLAHGAERRAAIQSSLHAALVALSWVGALAALGAARDLAEHAESNALRALALQRGFDGRAVWRARTLAGALRVARLVGIPALFLLCVAVARGESLAWATVMAPALALYAVAIGLCLGLLAQVSAQLSSRHPRALLAALLLGPLVLAQAYPDVPSVPGLFSTLLNQVMGSGAAFT
jgi:hypothetical protein